MRITNKNNRKLISHLLLTHTANQASQEKLFQKWAYASIVVWKRSVFCCLSVVDVGYSSTVRESAKLQTGLSTGEIATFVMNSG